MIHAVTACSCAGCMEGLGTAGLISSLPAPAAGLPNCRGSSGGR